jgi:4-hydroxyphenylacetate 3-monooxygenase
MLEAGDRIVALLRTQMMAIVARRLRPHVSMSKGVSFLTSCVSIIFGQYRAKDGSMGVRTGKQYVEGLRDDRRIYVNGELIRDVTNYPPFQRATNELARIYDRQHDAAYRDVLTYPSPTTSKPVSSSFLIPSTFEEVQWRMRGERTRAELTNGMMGRLPDYTNAEVADLAAIRNLLGRNEPKFGDNVWQYYELCREQDLALTHTLVDPQI